MPPSDPSATLQAIKDRAGVVAKLGPPRPGGDLINAAHRSAADVPRLVAALEAVLKVHRNAVNDDYPAEAPLCGECGTWVPCPTVLAITRTLNGETSA